MGTLHCLFLMWSSWLWAKIPNLFDSPHWISTSSHMLVLHSLDYIHERFELGTRGSGHTGQSQAPTD